MVCKTPPFVTIKTTTAAAAAAKAAADIKSNQNAIGSRIKRQC
jgi:hypothetical protein